MSGEVALIVGAGRGLSASLARLLAREGMAVALAARDVGKLGALVAETGARAYPCDAGEPDQVTRLFEMVGRDLGTPDLAIYNASGRYRGPIEELDPARVEQAWRAGAFGGFLVAQAAARTMLARGKGTILLTGATASVKALPGSVAFAMPKFALRALAQGLARELAPRGIHVAHFVIDGGIATGGIATLGAARGGGEDGPPDRWLDPDAIAAEYLHVHRQHRSAWTWEVELRPWVERF